MGPIMIDVEAAIKARFELLSPVLNERTRRVFSAAEAAILGRGGITIVSRITGVSRRAIAAGLAELRSPDTSAPGRIRRPGGGRRRRILDDVTLQQDLEQLINPVSKGDLSSPLRWTCTSVRKLAEELIEMGHATSHRMVAELLHGLGYSLQAKRKRIDGHGPRSRDAQFAYINQEVSAAFRTRQPVIAVDALMRDLTDQAKVGGESTTETKEQGPTRVAKLEDRDLGARPSAGLCERHVLHGKGRSGVMADHDTAAFGVEVIRRWWRSMGSAIYPQAERLLVVADIDGGDELSTQLWQSGLQKLANETQLVISVYHFPQATTRWSYIEHRLAATICQHWRGKPVVSRDVVVSLVTETPAQTGREESLEPELQHLPGGTELTYEETEKVQLRETGFHGDWNYSINPRGNVSK
jgi:hypothetical protein